MPYIREWAYQQGYQYNSISSVKELQILLDTALFQHLREDINLKIVDFETLHEKPALAAWLCWQCVEGGTSSASGNINARRALPARERLAKTGWSTYPVWIRHLYVEAKRLLKEKQASGGLLVERG